MTALHEEVGATFNYTQIASVLDEAGLYRQFLGEVESLCRRRENGAAMDARRTGEDLIRQLTRMIELLKEAGDLRDKAGTLLASIFERIQRHHAELLSPQNPLLASFASELPNLEVWADRAEQIEAELKAISKGGVK